tara:strand:- start:6356 stop:7297 length:942 start_codon:yes stop_codon:yes gene_type:complete
MTQLKILTSKKEFKQTDITTFKKFEVNFTNWYCPINDNIFNIDMQGEIKSGICGENIHTTKVNPWWEQSELTLISNNNICAFKRGNCFCTSDIKVHKAIDKNTYDWFQNKWPEASDDLLFATKDDEIIAVGTTDVSIDHEVHFHIGRRCNFDCSYCSSAVHDNFSPHTSIEEFKQALNLVEPYVLKNRNLILTGGEPTLNPLLPEMIQYGKKLNYGVNINTNGTASLTKLIKLAQLDAYLLVTFHDGFSNEKLMNKIGKLALIPNIKILVKIMSKEDSKFSQLVRSYIPDKPGGQNIEYCPIYLNKGINKVLQ